MSMVGFPLLLVPLAIYNIIALLMPGVALTEPLVTVTLISGAEWRISLSDILLALGIVLLLLEVIKGARPGAKYVTDHLLSLIVFGAAAAEFLLLPGFGTSTYCLLALLALVEFLSGITLRTRRGTAMATGAVGPGAGTLEQPVSPVPAYAPETVPAGETGPRDEYESKMGRTEAAGAGPSPEAASAGSEPDEAPSSAHTGPR